jgi:hypothetical protein
VWRQQQQPDVAVVRVRVTKKQYLHAKRSASNIPICTASSATTFGGRSLKKIVHVALIWGTTIFAGHNLRRRQTAAQRRSGSWLLKGCMIMAHDNGDGDVQTSPFGPSHGRVSIANENQPPV